jgi:Zn-dependent protease/CBS domain-containing protein
MFGRRIKLFSLLGFEVSIDLSWVLLAILVAWSLSMGYFPFQYRNLSTQAYWIMGITGAIGLFISIVVHEFSHSLAARRFGMPMKGITLFIFGGVAEMTDEPPSAKAEFWIAVVGPLSSIALSAIFYVLYQAAMAAGWSIAFNGVIGYLALINIILGIFNLIPAFPLDGGRILRSILWRVKDDLRWATRVSANIGSGFGNFLIILGVIRFLFGNIIGGMWFFLIGMFLRGVANASYQQMIARKALEGEPLEKFMKRDPITLPPSMSLDRMVDDYLYEYDYKLYPVVESDRLIGCVTSRQVKSVPKDKWNSTQIKDVMQACTDENTIDPKTDAINALSKMNTTDLSRLMVVQEGRLTGIVALKDMLRFLSRKVELEGR